LSGGCAAPEPKPLAPIPAPVVTKYVYKPIARELLDCKWPPAAPASVDDDLDLAGAYNRALDAGADCWRRLKCIAALDAGQQCDMLKEGS
jgi:hypothetical protein